MMITLKYKDKVIDATSFAKFHPGGAEILHAYHDKDITDVFLSMHGPTSNAHRMIEHMPVIHNHPAPNPPPTEQQRAFRELTAELQSYTRTLAPLCLTHWLCQFQVFLAITAAGFAAAKYLPTPLNYVISTPIFALTFTLLGWFSHDIVHKQLTTQSKYLMPIAYIIGNAVSGFSYDWWRIKHNTKHHPATNIANVDEDINTMPLIQWSATNELNASKYSINTNQSTHTGHIVYQHLYIWPLLLVARIWWRISSALHVVYHRKYAEAAFLTIHYIAYTQLLRLTNLSALHSLAYALAIETISGFLTSFVFIQSHNAKEILTLSDLDSINYWEHQLRTTTNITPGPINNFVSGYLNFQIEHHLFPWLPRLLIPYARERVKAIASRFNLPYREYSWWDSTRLVYDHLRSIAQGISRKAYKNH